MENYDHDHPIFVSCSHTLKCCLHNHIEVEVGFPRIYVPTKKEDGILTKTDAIQADGISLSSCFPLYRSR